MKQCSYAEMDWACCLPQGHTGPHFSRPMSAPTPEEGQRCGNDEMKSIGQFLLEEAEKRKQSRAERMSTENDAIWALFESWLRLKELGWREAMYAPTDCSPLEVIECGSTGIHPGFRDEERRFWIEDAGDLWPCTPVLFRPSTEVRP